MKRYMIIGAIVLAGAVVVAGVAFLVGYWPQHQRRQVLEGQVGALQAQLTEAQAGVRLGNLLGQLLVVEDAVSAQNYGEAQTLASQFFDAARAEARRDSAASSRRALEEIVQMRDPVTASLTRGDPETVAALREAETLLLNELGFSRKS